jgi:hypothetical protein
VTAMQMNTDVVVWLDDGVARAFLGVSGSAVASRWGAFGRVKELESPIGFWLTIDEIQEWKPDGTKVSWSVKPPVCLIRYEYVISAQYLDERTTKVGIRPTAPSAS